MKKYIGYRDADLQTPWARFLRPLAAQQRADIQAALERGPLPAGALPPLERASDLLAPGYTAHETGYTLEADGSLRVAVLTPMPGVTPAMWAWWFGWHGSHDNRYKLWHPVAHRSAQWKDGDQGREGYLGRVSLIEEYIGPKMEKGHIAFLPPAAMGLAVPDDQNEMVCICARVGLSQVPIYAGWLLHQVRRSPEGAEMRSRFWMGGRHVQWRGAPAWASAPLRPFARLPRHRAEELLRHCGEEMQHLSGFLPELWRANNP
jgi:hypothetical protein